MEPMPSLLPLLEWMRPPPLRPLRPRMPRWPQLAALHAAVDLGSAACVRLLLAAGARTDILHPQSGAAPISAALANGNVTCAMLLEHPNRAGIKAALV